MRFEDFVGLRYLMAKRDRNMLSVITLISVGGVAVGVMALIVVLSVMGGFENDFREKIIGTKAHVVISAKDAYLEDYSEIAEKVRSIKGVLGASPYVEAEVMLNSPTNLQGIILRGINVESINDVSDLAKNMKEGALNYLEDPDSLPTLSLSGTSVKSGSLVLQSDNEDGELSPEKRMRLEKAGAKAALAFVGSDHGSWVSSVGGELGAEPDLEVKTEESTGEIAEDEQDDGALEDDDFDGVLVAAPRRGADQEERIIIDGIDIGVDTWHDDDGDDAVLGSMSDEVDGYDRLAEAEIAPPRRLGRSMREMPGLSDDDAGYRKVGGIIAGRELKQNLNLFLGGIVNVMSPTGDVGPSGGLPKSRPFKVVGSYYSGMFEYDTKMAYISLKDAQMLINIGDRVTGIDVKVRRFEDSEIIRDKIRHELRDYDNVQVDDWKTLNGSLFSALMLEKTAMFIILTSIVLVASFNILCLLIMMVIEKGREIAIFKAMGARNESIVRIFVVQGAIIGGLGTVIGCVLGLLLCAAIASLGLKLPGEVYYLAQIPVDVKVLDVVLVCLSAMGISLLATVLPSRMAVKLKPVDGLRHD
ncbi:MAG: FtsX-like permease family protein [Bradymonadales bacterium]